MRGRKRFAGTGTNGQSLLNTVRAFAKAPELGDIRRNPPRLIRSEPTAPNLALTLFAISPPRCAQCRELWTYELVPRPVCFVKHLSGVFTASEP